MSETEAKTLIRKVVNLAFLNGTHEHEYLSDRKIKTDSERLYNAEKELEKYIEQLQQSKRIEELEGALSKIRKDKTNTVFMNQYIDSVLDKE